MTWEVKKFKQKTHIGGKIKYIELLGRSLIKMKRISLYCSILLMILMLCGCSDTTIDNVKAYSNESETVIDKVQIDSVEQAF